MLNRRLLFLLLAGACAAAANASMPRQTAQPVRTYDQANPAPDHIYFRHFLDSYFGPGADDDAETHFHNLLHSLGLTHSEEGEEKARRLHDILQERHRKLSRDIRRAEYRMLCQKRRTAWTDEIVFQQMDKLADVRDRIAENHYLNTMTMIDAELASVVDAAMQEGKTGFVSRRYAHKSMYEYTGQSVTEMLESLCRRRPQ